MVNDSLWWTSFQIRYSYIEQSFQIQINGYVEFYFVMPYVHVSTSLKEAFKDRGMGCA